MYKALPLGLLLATTLASCGGGSQPAAADATTAVPAATPAEGAAAKPAGPTIDVSTWKLTDLNKIAPLVHVSMNVPADAKMEKNPNGGVDITLNPNTLIQVSALMSSIKTAVKENEDYRLKDAMYVDAKKVVSDPTGYVYTRRMKPEANGHTYEPESHFEYFIEGKGGDLYEISYNRTLEGITGANGSDYPEAQAKAIYEEVKKTAKVK